MRFHQIGQQQVREDDKSHAFRLFFVEDDSDDVRPGRGKPVHNLVVAGFLSSRNRAGSMSGGKLRLLLVAFIGFHGVQFFRFSVDLYLTSRL